MKKTVSAVVAAMLMASSLVGCGQTNDNPKPGDDIDTPPASDFPTAPDGAVTSVDGNPALTDGEFELIFKQSGGKYSVAVAKTEGNSPIFYQDKPANIKVRGKGSGIGVQTYTERTFKEGYSTVSAKSYGYLATATVKTSFGSEFGVADNYYIASNGVFGMSRTVSVITADERDLGFASTVSLANAEDIESYDEFTYFIPGILYKDTQNVVSGAIASNLDLDKLSVKETRTGLPMVMAHNTESGDGLALMHLQPQIDVGGVIGGGVDGDVDDRLQYGAVGLNMQPVSVEFIYPCTENPQSYDAYGSATRKYHEVKVGNSHSYKVGIVPTGEKTYADAMVDTYQKAYVAQSIADVEMDIESVYNQNIAIFDSTYREYKYDGEIVSAGFPWSINLKSGEAEQGYSFQMGFVGQQVPAGYQLLRYGYAANDAAKIKKGKAIVDFWSSDKIQSTYFPTVWWDPQADASGGKRREYPCFLRCMVDGMEGMLDAYRIALAYGDDVTTWKNAILKFAQNLVAKQNADGSFNRAYNVNGSENNDKGNTQGMSKLNTPIAVRFLAKMYEFTGDEIYKTAALKAAEFSYNELYLGLNKYVGGTPDNPNTIDKEAAVYAQYCFDCAYVLTDDDKYLKAAEHAAVSTMSWTYTYDYKVPNQEKDEGINPFKNGDTIGFSIIALGHSGADNYSAYAYYEMYKLYVLTGKEFYKDSALLLQNATKLSTDYNGTLGYKYQAMMPEATNIADFQFGTVGTWLPWSGVANLEPITNFELTFGVKNIESLTTDLTAQRDALTEYGIGGGKITIK